ncbi:aminotransferase class I/II-fold pyridoxal phosphate-dependent enzyme [Sphingosinicella microcystinivorans]|uniref:aminotransferase class I/II-fold pyridoxal phosphate-dependent enzyme n=1 Tax=Sphingosinicella microcystinivorans TaxID=335406 RepID=UPI0022F3C74A|nr:aminotransferase class I/II-fold pyridoxal phosphate-dependent enzyme [Sphingosinicella microcystinivorans]WBX85604.1 aminotransferase class I/II-fold pyridoxal phosphate-dependent enzyme [Sphingosinicella microcystinivorans]
MVATIDPFHSIAISKTAHALAVAGRSVIHMEFGQPSTGAPSAAIRRAHEVLDQDPMGYWESPRLKERIAQHYGETYGVEVTPDQVVLTCGASPALVLALSSLFQPGDRIAFARPGYVAYRNTAKALYLDVVEIGCGPDQRFQLSAAAIEALDPAPAGIIIASPANPTGTIIPPNELAAIVAVCRRRGIHIVSDEIYHGLSYAGETQSILNFDRDAIVVNSFSKYFSMAGWRLGWLVVPPHLIEVARARMGNLFLTPPSLAQHAGLAAFDCVDELEGHVRVYERNRGIMLEALPAMGLREIAPPNGAFYIYADVGRLTSASLAFCQELLADTGVATAPGLDFDPVDGGRFIRFSFAVSTDRVQTAIERMVPWFAEKDRVSRQPPLET